MSDAASDSCFCSDGRDSECPRHGDAARERREAQQKPVTGKCHKCKGHGLIFACGRHLVGGNFSRAERCDDCHAVNRAGAKICDECNGSGMKAPPDDPALVNHEQMRAAMGTAGPEETRRRECSKCHQWYSSYGTSMIGPAHDWREVYGAQRRAAQAKCAKCRGRGVAFACRQHIAKGNYPIADCADCAAINRLGPFLCELCCGVRAPFATAPDTIQYEHMDHDELRAAIRGRDAIIANMAPVPLWLTCPFCKTRHVDRGDFATKPHHTHSCQNPRCGLTWRPAVVATVGVETLPGFLDADVIDACPAPMTEEESYAWAAQALRPLDGKSEPHLCQRAADLVAAAVREAWENRRLPGAALKREAAFVAGEMSGQFGEPAEATNEKPWRFRAPSDAEIGMQGIDFLVRAVASCAPARIVTEEDAAAWAREYLSTRLRPCNYGNRAPVDPYCLPDDAGKIACPTCAGAARAAGRASVRGDANAEQLSRGFDFVAKELAAALIEIGETPDVLVDVLVEQATKAIRASGCVKTAPVVPVDCDDRRTSCGACGGPIDVGDEYFREGSEKFFHKCCIGSPELPHALEPQPTPAQSSARPIWPVVIDETEKLGSTGTVPRAGNVPGIMPLLLADMRARDEQGFAKYKVRLQAENGRDHLADAYQEALDESVHLRTAIEKDGAGVSWELWAAYHDAVRMAFRIRTLLARRDGEVASEDTIPLASEGKR